MSIFCLPSKIGAIFLPSLLCSKSKAKQHFRFGAIFPNPPALLQLQTYAHFSPWSISSKSTDFAPTPALSNLSGLGQFLHIHPLCSNFRHMPTFPLGATSPNLPALLQLPMPHIAPKKDKARDRCHGLCLQFENRYFICFLLILFIIPIYNLIIPGAMFVVTNLYSLSLYIRRFWISDRIERIPCAL